MGPNQTDRLVHEFAIFGKSAVYDLKQPYFCGKQAQIAYWEGKTNEYDGYKTFLQANIGELAYMEHSAIKKQA